MPAITRTSEFRTCVESVRRKTQAAGGMDKGSGAITPKRSGQPKVSRSEFTRQAAGVAKEIEATMGKLEKLAQLAKRKTLFDDRPVEISELTYIIKQDIASLNGKISHLQSVSGHTNEGGKEHHNNVVIMLQGKLADASIGFKDMLEIRTQNMKATKERSEQLGMASADRIQPDPSSSSSQSGLRSRRLSGSGQKEEKQPSGNEYLALDMGEMQDMQMETVDGEYTEARSRAIEGIESTIAELGQIFSQLSHMVAQQGESVQRIDADVVDIEASIGGAQRELLKTLSAATSNRSLMLKVFGVVLVFFLLFVLVS